MHGYVSAAVRLMQSDAALFEDVCRGADIGGVATLTRRDASFVFEQQHDVGDLLIPAQLKQLALELIRLGVTASTKPNSMEYRGRQGAPTLLDLRRKVLSFSVGRR
jgi:hypothetical protein